MTCIVALREWNRIYLGADSCVSGSHTRITGKPKVLRKGEFLLGGAGHVRGNQLFKYSLFLPNPCEGEDSYSYLINTVTVKMRQVFRVHGFLREEEKQQRAANNSFILIYRGEIYKIGSDFSVNNPLEDYFAVGSGEHFALGSLYSTEKTNLDPETRIKIALDAASKYDGFVSPPYEIISMEWDGFDDGSAYRFYDSDGTIKEDYLKNDKKEEKKEDLEIKNGDNSTK